MKVQAAVKRETGKIAAGVAVLSVLMVAVYLIIGRFSLPVLWGTLLGAAFAIGNFFLMALTVQQAAESMNGVQLPPEPVEGEEEAESGESAAGASAEVSPEAKRARKRMQLSYTGRMALLVVMAIAAIKLPCFDAVPALIAQLFPRIVIFVQSILKKEKNAQ